MTECKKYKDLMFPYLDGDLKAVEAEELESHISECSDCAQELTRDKKTLELIKLSFRSPKTSLSKPVMKAIDAELRRKNIMRYSTTAAACIVGVALIGTFTFMSLFNQNKNATMMDEAAPEMSIAATAGGSAETNADDYIVDVEEFDEGADVDDAELPMFMFGYAAGGESGETAAPEADENALIIEDISPIIEENYPNAAKAEEAAPAAPAPKAQEETQDGVTLKSLPPTQSDESNDETINFYTEIYAPDYIGTVRAVIMSYEKPNFVCEQISDGDNFTVYIYEYDETMIEKYSDAIMGSESEAAVWTLYVMLK